MALVCVSYCVSLAISNCNMTEAASPADECCVRQNRAVQQHRFQMVAHSALDTQDG